MAAGRVHHAWIFHGPKGVGKFTAALTFASLLLDPTTKADASGVHDSPGDSDTRKQLRAGTHPDLFVIVKELAKFHDDPTVRDRKLTSIPVEVIRTFLVEHATLRPSMATGSTASRVFIVDDADLLNVYAQNALLKILEEPPPGVVIILVTSAEQELLPTIRSRSQRVYFGPLATHEMNAWLERSPAAALLGEGDGEPVSPEETDFLVRLAAGAPGVFLAAREGGIHAWWKQLGPMLVAAEKGQYSPEMGSLMAELIGKWAEAWVDSHDNASKEAANKDAAAWMFRLVGTHLQRRLAETARANKGPDTLEPILAMFDRLREAESEIDANVGAQFVMEKLSGELSLRA
jgi:DNA polymerase-3 subunit delta'